jgi:hypothetical protein
MFSSNTLELFVRRLFDVIECGLQNIDGVFGAKTTA